MTVKEWLKETHKDAYSFLRPHAQCSDGFGISIQASRFHYCIPRDDVESCQYEAVELGYPSYREELIEEFREGSIYPFVPIEIVDKLVNKHGGIINPTGGEDGKELCEL